MTDFKSTLIKLNENLLTLREREAKYGGSAPLDLLNQITDHQKAIALTEQALVGELSEVEWREATKPLLAFSEGRVINIEAETYIAGDVVYGNKIITHIYEALPPLLPPAEAKERQDLGILLKKVKTFWIEGVLEKSVHHIAKIDLDKEIDFGVVEHPWERDVELSHLTDEKSLPHKKIGVLFDQMNRALLILGAPGSGKTITLLELAKDLINRVEIENNFTQPIPVVFNLSSWRKGKSLIDWLAAELSTKYQIPERYGRPWLEKNRILPLLDGLDENREELYMACVQAINDFGEKYGLCGLVVCSRENQYMRLPIRLRLNGAIRLRPLTPEKVDNYLTKAGPKMAALRETLRYDTKLLGLAKSPLMLNIMSQAYQDVKIIGQGFDTIEVRRKHLFDTYLQKMFKRKNTNQPFSAQQTIHRLGWLAKKMSRYTQTVFLIERIQPSWLCSQIQKLTYSVGFVLIAWLITVTSGLLIINLTNVLLVGQLILGSLKNILLIFSIFTVLLAIPLAPLIMGYDRNDLLGIYPVEIMNWSWTRAKEKLKVGLRWGLVMGLSFSFFVALASILSPLTFEWKIGMAILMSVIVVIMTLVSGLSFGIMAGIIGNELEIKTNPNQGIHQSIKNAIIAGLSFLLASWFTFLVIILSFGPILVISSLFIEDYHNSESIQIFVEVTLGAPALAFVFLQLFGWPLGPLGALLFGGLATIKHYILRLILWWNGYLPFRLVPFLDYCVERIFLRKVGGGYIFIHRYLMEYFASLTPEDIERLSNEIEPKKAQPA